MALRLVCPSCFCYFVVGPICPLSLSLMYVCVWAWLSPISASHLRPIHSASIVYLPWLFFMLCQMFQFAKPCSKPSAFHVCNLIIRLLCLVQLHTIFQFTLSATLICSACLFLAAILQLTTFQLMLNLRLPLSKTTTTSHCPFRSFSLLCWPVLFSC